MDFKRDQRKTILDENVKTVIQKYARRCDVTGKGMNAGYIWGDGAFYTKTQKATILEFRKDISCGAYDFDEVGSEELLKKSDRALLKYGYDNDVFYWTQWDEPKEGEEWYDKNGNYHEPNT